MKEHLLTHDKNDFIRGWYITDSSLCDDIINYFKASNNTFSGHSSGGVDKQIKDSTDCYLNDPVLLNRYVNMLQDVTAKYIEIYPYVNHYAPWGINEHINIQQYTPEQAYYGWHTERGTGNSTRHMAFMTYLNTVEEGGETEFLHQEIKVKPEKGLTLVWPVDWTFTHRGCAAPRETKHITTGWFSYLERN
jgi:hypothetical protein|tara:strand:- start:47 stop:619 length:573 start_codon:yes stop_codon:yes gene_type:complete